MRPNSNAVALSNDQFDKIVQLAQQIAGLAIPATKKSLVQSRITRRMRKIGVLNGDEYLKVISCDPFEAEEFISALTTNVSHFFREPHHFEKLRHVLHNQKGKGKIRIWSAGCSSGQEPYSIAMTIADEIPNISNFDIKILATDIDKNVLTKSKRGIYSSFEVEGIPDNKKKEYFSINTNGEFVVSKALSNIITFKQLNLHAENWPMTNKFDVIFCRNVAIYFDAHHQEVLWKRFSDALNEGGVLMLGHSERIQNFKKLGISTAGVTTYEKTSPISGR